MKQRKNGTHVSAQIAETWGTRLREPNFGNPTSGTQLREPNFEDSTSCSFVGADILEWAHFRKEQNIATET